MLPWAKGGTFPLVEFILCLVIKSKAMIGPNCMVIVIGAKQQGCDCF